MTRLRRNAIANYFGRGYSALIGVVVMPLYLGFLGAESFGLVGFFLLLQSWLYLLDLGLSPTLARQVAFAGGRGEGFAQFARLLRNFEIIFLFIAVAVAATILSTSGLISASWIRGEALDRATVEYCVRLMGVIVAMRFFASLYGSGIRGLEDQVWLNGAQAAIATFRALGALALMVFVSADVSLFFEFNVFVWLLEVLVLARRFYTQIGVRASTVPLAFDLGIMRSVAPFALSIAYTAGIWVVLSQTDKLILSVILSLEEFGYFSIVALLAGGILVATAPVGQAILPRMTALLAARNSTEMQAIYSNSSQLVAVIGCSAALFFAAFPEYIVFAWTGDQRAASWCADVLPWFALGNGILSVAAFQHYLQNSFGDLRLQVVGSTISAIVQVPVIYVAATRYGAAGAGIAWFLIRSIWFLAWTAVVHRKFLPGFHLQWLTREILPIVSLGVVAAFCVRAILPMDLSMARPLVAVYLVVAGALLLAGSAAGSRYLRQRFSRKVLAKTAR